MKNVGESQGLVYSAICSAFSCFYISCSSVCNFFRYQMPLLETGRFVRCSKVRVVGTLKILTVFVPCVCTIWRVWLFLIFFSEEFLWIVCEIGELLICVFHGCNKSCPHKFMAILATCEFNFSMHTSSSIYWSPLALCFTWDKALIPQSWMFISWRGQSGCK